MNTDHDETLDKAVWHILAQQMTHAINCEDPKHRKAMSCVAFTAGAHVEMMQLINEARIDELKQLWNSTQSDIVPSGIPANDMSEELHKRIEKLRSES